MVTRDRGERVCLGVITGAQGVRGEVVIKSYTEKPEDIGSYGPLTDADGARSYDIEIVRLAKKGVIAKVKGVGDRDQAGALRGVELFVDASLLSEPDEDGWYRSDLVGLQVVDGEGGLVGAVVSVQNFGAGDLLEIELAGTSRTEFLPLHHDYVSDVSLEEGRISIILPKDLWD